MESLSFLFEAFFGGLLALITEELVQSAQYSLPTLLLSLSVGILAWLATRRYGARTSLILSGALVATCAAILRPALVYGGVVTFLAGVDCFASQNMGIRTYVLFALSGAFAGFTLSRRQEQHWWIRIAGLLGIATGVLYHFKIAQGWWSASPLVAFPLFVGEFLAPSAFGIALIWLASIYAAGFRLGYGGRGEAVGHAVLANMRPTLRPTEAPTDRVELPGGILVRNPYKMIMMKCPISGADVATGINWSYFEMWDGNPPQDGAEFKCSECGQKHTFDGTNTWFEDLK